MTAADLFGPSAPPIAGLAYAEEVIDRGSEARLIARLDALDLAPFRFQGWEAKRLTHSFGWRYDFDDSSFRETDPIPDWLRPLRETAARLADTDPLDFVHALAARYDPGAGIGWHRDRPVFGTVVGFSLGSPAVLRFRRRIGSGFDRVRLPVEPRSAYLLSGEARRKWEHGIAPGETLRFSITFRTLSDFGRRKAAAP